MVIFNKMACPNPPPPSSFNWTLPLVKTLNWDVYPNRWGIPLYGLQTTIPNISILKPSANPSSTTGCTLQYGLGSCPTANNCLPLVGNANGCPSCADGSIVTSVNYTAANTSCGVNKYATLECFNVGCNTICGTLDAENTCPEGTSLGFIPSDLAYYNQLVSQFPSVDGLGTPPRTTCAYKPKDISDGYAGIDIENLSKYNFPPAWQNSLVYRYTLYAFIRNLNANIYGDYDSQFHQQFDPTDMQNSLILLIGNQWQNALGYSATAPNYNDFAVMLENLSLPHYFYTQPNTDGSTDFRMLFYALAVDDGVTSDVNAMGVTAIPTTSTTTTFLQKFTTETIIITNSNQLVPTSSSPANTFAYPPTNNDLLNNPYYIFVDLHSLTVYNVGVGKTQLITVQQAINANSSGDYYIVGRIFDLSVTKLSPVTSYWFDKTASLTSSTELALYVKTVNDTNMYPEAYYTSICNNTSFSSQCASVMRINCAQYIPTQIFQSINVNLGQYFMTMESSSCQCYNTKLTPAITGASQKIPGMCFTGACTANPQLMTAFGLTDDVCKQYCPTVYNWLINGINGVAVRQYIDAEQYKNLCGTNYVPTAYSKINYKVLGIGIFCAAGICFAVWWKWRKISTTVITVAISTVVTILLSFLLNGVPECNPNPLIHDYQCKNGLPVMLNWFNYYLRSSTGNKFINWIAELAIPKLFCQSIACECVSDSQCGTNDECISGVCSSR